MPEHCQGASPILLLEWWKPVIGWEGRYEVSNTGKIRSLGVRDYRNVARLIGQRVDTCGYLAVSLYKNGPRKWKRVHHLVAIAFLGDRPTNLVINHIDGRKSNNKVSNLEYITNAENLKHAYKSNLMAGSIAAARNQTKKLSDEQALWILALPEPINNAEIARSFGVSITLIRHIRIGRLRPYLQTRASVPWS